MTFRPDPAELAAWTAANKAAAAAYRGEPTYADRVARAKRKYADDLRRRAKGKP